MEGSAYFPPEGYETQKRRASLYIHLLLADCFLIPQNTMQMDPSDKRKGPPPAVKKVLSLFGSGREEDRLVGYLSFLKVGPKLLKFLPGTMLSYCYSVPGDHNTPVSYSASILHVHGLLKSSVIAELATFIGICSASQPVILIA